MAIPSVSASAQVSTADRVSDEGIASQTELSVVAACPLLLGAFAYQEWFLIPVAVIFLLAMAVIVWGYALWQQRQKRHELFHQEVSLAERASECDRLRQENNHLNYDMIVLYQFVNNLGNCRSTTAVYQEFLATVLQSIEPDVGGLFMVEPDGSVKLAVHHGLNELAKPEQADLIEDGLVGWVALNGREVLVEDAATDMRFPDLREPPFAPNFKTAIGLPLLFQNRTLGVALIGRAEGIFTQDELRLLFIIANEGALYLQNLGLYEEVATMAISDGSTGLYNHRYFFEQIDKQLADAKESGLPLSLLMVDIDNFKPFNDLYGHLTGDAILREVADFIKAAVKPEHFVARYGGEEFAVLMPGTDTETAYRMAEGMRQSIAAHAFGTLDGRHARVTISVGLATYPQHLVGTANTVTDLIAAADYQLVMRAKVEGKNLVRHAN